MQPNFFKSIDYKFIFALILFFLNSCQAFDEQELTFDSEEGLAIISTSRNFSVYANETVQLPCLIKKQSSNTVVIWNQCEDPECSQVRNPLTVNKDNFIQDLRFRVLFENLQDSIKSGEIHPDTKHVRSRFTYRDAVDTNSYGDINKWTLEIRKFSKKDEGCYQCQLNSMDIKTIYYCLNLQKKAFAEPEKLTVGVNGQIHLKCHTDENVRMSQIKWYRNGQRLISNSQIKINRYHANELLHSTLTIAKATYNDAGTYSCRFDEIHARIEVHVVSAEEGKYYSKKISHHSLELNQQSKYSSSEEPDDMTDSDDYISPAHQETRKISTETSEGAYFDSFKFFAISSNATNMKNSIIVNFFLICSIYFISTV